MQKDDPFDPKDVEFYAAGVNAWYSTSLEYDKSIFSLSAGGIGLLITLLTTVGLTAAWLKFLYVAAILCFMTSLVAVLVIFRRNRNHIEQVLGAGGGTVKEDPLLKRLDLAAIISFGTGAALASTIGITIAFTPSKPKEESMSSDSQKPTSQPTPSLESFDGIKNLQPTGGFTKSFNGIGNLQPQPTASAPVPQPAAPAPAASPSPQTNSGEQK
jgi:hypothetical protein